MSNTQIWVFGVLAFFLLTTLFRAMRGWFSGRGSGGADNAPALEKLTKQVERHDAETTAQLSAVRTDLRSIAERLARVERILKDVE